MRREVLPNVIVDLAYVGNRADDLRLFANFNQAAPNDAAGTCRSAARSPAGGGSRRSTASTPASRSAAAFGTITQTCDARQARIEAAS